MDLLLGQYQDRKNLVAIALALFLGVLFSSALVGQEEFAPPLELQQSFVTPFDTVPQADVSQTVLSQPVGPQSAVEAVGEQVITTNSRDGVEVVTVGARDEIWLIDGRSAHCCPRDLSRLKVFFLSNSQWNCDTLDNLSHAHLNDTSRQTMLFVHGNRYDLESCRSRGLQFYKRMFQCGIERPAVRLVLFCWKSEQQTIRPILDLKIKTRRSLALSCSFARLLEKFDPRDLTICSYSLGAQVVTKAFEDPEFMAKCNSRFKVAMIAPAFDPDYSCQKLSRYSTRTFVSETQLFINRNDRVIKVSEFVNRRRCRDSGSTSSRLGGGSECSPIVVNDITNEVPSQHDLNSYSESTTLRDRITQLVSSPQLDNQPELQPALQFTPATISVESDLISPSVNADALDR